MQAPAKSDWKCPCGNFSDEVHKPEEMTMDDINGMSSFRAALAQVRSYGPNPLAAAAIGKYVTSRVRHGHHCDHRPCQTLLCCVWAW